MITVLILNVIVNVLATHKGRGHQASKDLLGEDSPGFPGERDISVQKRNGMEQ